MSTNGPIREPEDGPFRRGLFARREPSPAEPMMTATEYRLADTLQRAIDERLEDGLRSIEEQATALMREVATEVWRSSSKDNRPEQERIVTLLSRDQAIRSLIASSDERFQSLAVRTARLEDHLKELAENNRVTKDAIQTSASAIRDIADSPTLHGVEGVRTQLEQVERHIAAAFAHMDDRDKVLTESVLEQVREHGELIAHETARIVEAMESYVQGGAEAVGRLAQRIEEHAQLFLTQDHDITDEVRRLNDEQTQELTEQLAMVSERVGLHGRNQQLIQSSMERLMDARVRGLGELIRSDSDALRRLIEERQSGMQDALTQNMDERIATLEQLTDQRLDMLERTLGEQVLALSTATSASVERNMERLTEAVGALDGIDEMIVESQGTGQERLQAQLATAQADAEDRLMQHVDERVTAIAKLIRSDNRVLAERMEARAETESGDGLRDVLRGIKELQAGLASDLMGTMDRRFQTVADQLHQETQSTAEAMIKVAEVLGDKIDRLSVRVDEGGSGDLQIVIDRMSDAIQAMSAAGRRQTQTRYEID